MSVTYELAMLWRAIRPWVSGTVGDIVYGMRSSMSRKGDCWDNAPTESLWGRLKVGRLHGRKFATRRQAMDEDIAWLTFNHRRLHSSLGYVSPMQFEQSWHAAQHKNAA